MKSINRILIFGLNIVLSCFVFMLVYSLVYSKIERSYEGKASVYEDYCKLDEKLSKFNDLKANIDKQKSEIVEDIHNYQDHMYSNKKNEETYKDKIVAVLSKVGLSVKEKRKDGSYSSGNVTLKQKNGVALIEMTANYEQMCRFLFELERFSIIQELKMDYQDSVFLKCVPVQYSKLVDDYFNDKIGVRKVDKEVSLSSVSYFEEIFDKTQKAKKNLGKIPTWEDFKPLPRSPFYKVPKVSSSGGKVYSGGSAPSISIDGIMYDKTDPIAIIGGKFYHLGDTYGGAKIVNINPSSIQVNYYGRIHTYKMKY